jgi:hypothetical protein
MVQPDTRSYDYFDHDADAGIVVRGPTRTAAFEAAAEASFAVMGDPARIRPRRCIRVAFEETNAELGLAQSSARRGATVGHGLGGAMATGRRGWGQSERRDAHHADGAPHGRRVGGLVCPGCLRGTGTTEVLKGT